MAEWPTGALAAVGGYCLHFRTGLSITSLGAHAGSLAWPSSLVFSLALSSAILGVMPLFDIGSLALATAGFVGLSVHCRSLADLQVHGTRNCSFIVGAIGTHSTGPTLPLSCPNIDLRSLRGCQSLVSDRSPARVRSSAYILVLSSLDASDTRCDLVI